MPPPSPPALPLACPPAKASPSNNSALVPAPAPAPPHTCLARSLAQRRVDRDAHTHGTVWTKDPHGGAHRPADVGGVDAAAAALAAATHRARLGAEAVAGPRPLPGSGPAAAASLPLGYAARAPPGPTTNFVGDAMVGGAAGLVAARLEAANEGARAAGTAGLPPLAGPLRLLTGEGGGCGAAPPPPPHKLTPVPCTPAQLRAQALALMAAVEGRGVGVGVEGRREAGWALEG